MIHRAEVFTPGDYHYLINKDGTITPITDVAEKCEHACFYNGNTIAIAVFGCFASSLPGQNYRPSTAQLETCVALMRTLNAHFGNKLWAAGHSQLGAKGTLIAAKLLPGYTCPGENFPIDNIIAKSGCKPFVA